MRFLPDRNSLKLKMKIMKNNVWLLILLGFASSVFAAEKYELEDRVRSLTTKFEQLQSKPDKSIPPEHLKNAKGIILLDRTKAGFIFAYQGGNGVAMVRDPKSGNWSAPAFMGASEGSLGFQIGGQQSFVVILLMHTNATRGLTESTFEFGGEASGTAGDSSVKEEGKVESAYPAVLVYDDVKGLYGGAAIKGGSIAPDDKANRIYYEKYVTMQDILFDKKVKPTEAGRKLASAIEENAKRKK